MPSENGWQIEKGREYRVRNEFQQKWNSLLWVIFVYLAMSQVFYQIEWVWQWLQLQFGSIGRLRSEESGRKGQKRETGLKMVGQRRLTLVKPKLYMIGFLYSSRHRVALVRGCNFCIEGWRFEAKKPLLVAKALDWQQVKPSWIEQIQQG